MNTAPPGPAHLDLTPLLGADPMTAVVFVLIAMVVVAVGADTPGKQELDPKLLAGAGLVVVDDRAQCAEQGELQHAPPRVRTQLLGAVLAADEIRPRPGTRTVVDLTGLGVQDAAVAALALSPEGMKGA